MEKEFIPYEQALALKALGFDEPCFAGYNENPVNDDDLRTLIYPTIKLDFEDEDIIFNDNESDEPNCWTIEHDVILAPTYSQCFRWFREKYNLFGHIEVENNNSFYWHIRNPEQFISSQTSETYEEAEIECLKKLIEIVEQKNEK